jgi:hypothetical protein
LAFGLLAHYFGIVLSIFSECGGSIHLVLNFLCQLSFFQEKESGNLPLVLSFLFTRKKEKKQKKKLPAVGNRTEKLRSPPPQMKRTRPAFY